MLNEHAQAWVEALRSGKYKQASGYLRRSEDSFCCLGVACDLYAQEHPEASWSEEGDVWNFFGNAALLPDEVREWIGLAEEHGRFEATDYYSTLTSLNDSGYAFDDIAYVIESEPAGLFA